MNCHFGRRAAISRKNGGDQRATRGWRLLQDLIFTVEAEPATRSYRNCRNGGNPD